MHELKFEEKVRLWRELRDRLETHPTPFIHLLNFINNLPRASGDRNNGFDPKLYPQPWELIQNDCFSHLTLTLLMCYTLQLTDRFSGHDFEIHIIDNQKTNQKTYAVCIDRSIILSVDENDALEVEDMPQDNITIFEHRMPKLQ